MLDKFLTYQATRGFTAATVRRRSVAIGRWQTHLAPLGLGEATLADVEEWLRSTRALATRRAYLSDLKAFYRWAERRGLVASNPAASVEQIRVPKPLPKPAPQEAIAAAFERADGDTQLMLMLGALAGLRRAEIAALHWEDVNLDATPPVLVVRCGKGGKDRVVPLHPTLQTMLARGRRAGYVFPSATELGHMAAGTVGERLAAALSHGRDKRVTAHQLRHFFGTSAAQAARGNLTMVATLMGHQSIETTRGYVAWANEGAAEVVAAIPSGLGDELAARRARRTG